MSASAVAPPPWSSVELANGLRVLVQPSHRAPVAAVYLWLEAGTADETPPTAGVAHFLEHMVFKGTARRGVGASAAAIEELGGDLNAYTTWDQTVLHATVAAPWWREALDVIADMALAPTFDPGELEREKQVVIEEIRGYDDDPDSVADDVLQALVHPEHPYGRPILGTARSVAALTRDDVVGFWRRHWGPRRAILAVAGPVTPEEVREAAEALLGGWEGGARRNPIPLARRAPGRIERVARPFESTTARLAWPAPPLGHPDLPALDVLAAALGQGQSSLLTQRLQLQEGIAASCWADVSTRVGGGAFTIGFLPMQEESAEAVRRALEVVGRVVRAGLPGAVVARARDALLSDFLFGHETVDGIAHDLAWYTARMGSPDARAAWCEQIAAVDAAQVLEVARRWLAPESGTVVVVDKQLRARDLQRAVAEAHRRWVAPTTRRAPAGIVRRTLDNGVRLVVQPEEGELCAIRTLSLGGCLAVPERQAGIPSAWAAMITTGAGPWDAQGYGTACDTYATVVDAVAGRNTLGLQASFPADQLDEAAELVVWPLLEPHFDDYEWDRVRGELLEDLRTLDDRPNEVASRLVWASLWPNHPWRHPWAGTRSSLERITPAALARWHELQIQPRNLVVAVVGGVDPEEALAALAPWFERLEPGPDLPRRRVPPPPRGGHRTAQAGHEQATVLACLRGASLRDPDRHALHVASTLLGAQGGRLFLELREARGLGYAVWAQHVEGVDGGVFEVGVTTDPDRADEARAALVDELRRFAAEGPTDAEIARAVRMLLGQRAMSLQRVVGRAVELATTTLYDLPFGLDAYRRELEAVDADGIRSALARRGVDDPLVITVRPR